MGDPKHYPVQCAYDNLLRGLLMICECGYAARGDTWEEVGSDMDDHLEGQKVDDAQA